MNKIFLQIQYIYDTLSIHKALFIISNESYRNKLYNILRNNNFPIGKLDTFEDVHKFNINLNRILLIDSIDLKCIKLLSKEYNIDLKNVNLILNINEKNNMNIDASLFSSDIRFIDLCQ